jgi:hypothetical protein
MLVKTGASDLLWPFRASVLHTAATTVYVPEGYVARRLILHNRDATNYVLVLPYTAGTINDTDGDADTGQGEFAGSWSENVFTVAAAKTVTAVTKAADGSITCAGHNFFVGNEVVFSCAGMTQLNGTRHTVKAVTDADTFTIEQNTTAYTTFTSGTVRLSLNADNAGTVPTFLRYGITGLTTMAREYAVNGWSTTTLNCQKVCPPTKLFAIAGVTKANPGVITTATTTNFAAGDRVIMYGMTDMTSQNGIAATVASATGVTVTLSDDLSAATAAETTGGYVTALARLVSKPDIKVYAGMILDIPCSTRGVKLQANTATCAVQGLLECDRV